MLVILIVSTVLLLGLVWQQVMNNNARGLLRQHPVGATHGFANRQRKDSAVFCLTVLAMPAAAVLFAAILLWLVDSPWVEAVPMAWVLTILASLAYIFAVPRVFRGLRLRTHAERWIRLALAGCAALALFITFGVFVTLVGESIAFFRLVSWHDFLFGVQWSPQIALFEDEVGSSGAFGLLPVLSGTLLISGVAMLFAVPVGLMVAIYLSFYASLRFRQWGKPFIEILAGIPTVVYGLFAATIVSPLVRDGGSSLGLSISDESALVAGGVMGVMIIPFVSSLSDDVLRSVPRGLAEGSYGLGATKSEVVRTVVLPTALPGLIGAFLLALSRAIGETMIVVMAAGLVAKLTANPFEAVTTVTVQIVTLLVGDHSFDSAKTLSAFALALALFMITLVLNLVALITARRARKVL